MSGSKPSPLQFIEIDSLYLDPKNPRLGRRHVSEEFSQEVILDLMTEFKLDELAVSFLENGFWPQEAIIVVREEVYGAEQLIVVEGNRRLAALKLLHLAAQDKPFSKKWGLMVDEIQPQPDLFESVPCIEVSSRKDVISYIGFRHVTGIKEWGAAEKAQYIADMVDAGDSYKDVAQKIGVRLDTARRNYVSYKILLQMEGDDEIELEKVEKKFSVLFLSLREAGVKKYLNIDVVSIPELTHEPIPQEHLDNLKKFAKWLFGTHDEAPLFSDSRNIGLFGKVLASEEGVEYLETADDPDFDEAVRKAKAHEDDLITSVSRALNEVETVLSRAYYYSGSEELIKKSLRLKKAVDALTSVLSKGQ